MNKTRDNSLGEGIYFELASYAGFIRRLSAIIVDFTVLFAFAVSLWFVLLEISWDSTSGDFMWDPNGVFWLLLLIFAWVYLAVLKMSKWRTVGYQLTGLKIVSTRGTKPSIFAMSFRMLLWILGPFNLFFDLIWLNVDSERQSLRDCYAGTYVVLANARPIGTAPIHLTYYNALGYTFMYPRVVRPKNIPG